MRRFHTRVLLALAAVFFLTAGAEAFDLGGALNKVLQKKDVIIKTTKALRKGFAELTGEEEYYIGRAVAARILSDYHPYGDSNLVQYLNTLGGTLVRFSPRPEIYGGYHFTLIDSPEINAFAAPGGFIFVTTGLYRSVRSEEQLAAVLAHEISHITLRHGLAAIKSSRLTEAFTIIGTEAVKEYTSEQVAKLTAAFEGTIDDIVNKMVVSGYSRTQEFEADKEALKLAYRAGYNPEGLGEFLQTLDTRTAEAGGKGFYSTHPAAGDRLGKVTDYAASEKMRGETSTPRTARFEKHRL